MHYLDVGQIIDTRFFMTQILKLRELSGLFDRINVAEWGHNNLRDLVAALLPGFGLHSCGRSCTTSHYGRLLQCCNRDSIFGLNYFLRVTGLPDAILVLLNHPFVYLGTVH